MTSIRRGKNARALQSKANSFLYKQLLLCFGVFLGMQLMINHEFAASQRQQDEPAATDVTRGGKAEKNGRSDFVRKDRFKTNYPETNNTVSACLFIMDDTIRLLEWLAYHATVLPLGHLVVTIDPKSLRTENILRILEQYQSILPRPISIFTNDTWLGLGPEEGWYRQVRSPAGTYRNWFKDPEGDIYKAQAHKRRQNYFFAFCLKTLFEAGSRTHTILIDTDEFFIYNYRHINAENISHYDAATNFITPEDIDHARGLAVPFREKLPSLEQRVTVADYLSYHFAGKKPQSEAMEDVNLGRNERRQAAMREHALITAGVRSDTIKQRCFRVPHLRFSSYESPPKFVAHKQVPNPNTLMTLRHRKVGPTESLFSKAMLDLSQAQSSDWFTYKNVVNVHTPSRRMCGRTSKNVHFSGSGTDYISSLFRINHYRSGTIETYLERSGDYRGGSIWRLYAERNIDPVRTNDDIRPWVSWFIDKVGYDKAKELLLDPMVEAYREMEEYDSYKESKEILQKLQGNDPLEHGVHQPFGKQQFNHTSQTISACLFLENDNIRFLEWVAYHATVLPLGNLIVGISKKSTQASRLSASLQAWTGHISFEIWQNDEWLDGVPSDQGFGRVKIDDVAKASDQYTEAENLKRRLMFNGKCLNALQKKNADWTLVAEVDEFITFNYKGLKEDPLLYDATEAGIRTKEDIIQSRTEHSPLRNQLPLLSDQVTIADYLQTHDFGNCIVLPALNFSSVEASELERDQMPSSSLNKLMTIRQRKFGRKEGMFTRTLLDISKVNDNSFEPKMVESEHNANNRVCDKNGKYETTDYIAALFRLNKYVIGSLEAFVEHESTGEDGLSLEHFENATMMFNAYGYTDQVEMSPWVDWFVEKFGLKDAKKMLFDPLEKAHKELDGHKIIREARDNM